MLLPQAEPAILMLAGRFRPKISRARPKLNVRFEARTGREEACYNLHFGFEAYHYLLLTLQNSSNDQTKGPEDRPPERAFAAIDEEADDAEDDGACDDEFHDLVSFLVVAARARHQPSRSVHVDVMGYSLVGTPSASRVARSGAPVGAKPFCSWKARIALRDPFPQTPSGVPASKPPAFNMVWMAR